MEIKPVGLYNATQEVEALYAALLDTQAENARLRAENERLRQLGTEIRNQLRSNPHVFELTDWGLASIRACDAWDSALAALDQERK